MLLMALTIFLGLAGRAHATTYYISYASGSNSNSGTSTSSPWKTAPYMQHGGSCDSGGPNYTHNVGDKFVFKGGDTWPNACFTMILQAGGNSSVNDYYGVCLSTDADSPCSGGTSWPSSGWTRPIFDAGGAPMAGAENNFIYVNSNSVGYFTVDNIEMKNQIGTQATASTCDDASIEIATGTGNALWENLYLHDFWISLSTLENANGPSAAQGGLCVNAGTTTTANNDLITGVDGGVLGQSAAQTPVLSCFRNIQVAENSTCEYYANGILGGAVVHDNLFAYGSLAEQSYTLAHTNDIEDTWQTGMVVYNNLLHDSTVAQHIAVAPNGIVFSNVAWNLSNGTSYAMVDNGIDNGQDYPNATTYFINNTFACSATNCIDVHLRGGTTTLGAVIIQNNLWVTPGSAPIYDPSNATYAASNNHSMSSAEASTYGFTAANKYYPTSSDPKVVASGTNLSSLCSGKMTALCQDPRGAFWFGGSYANRPTSGNWDVEAYQFNSSSSSTPAAPTALVATVQ
jgi:hypothetical protein